MFKRKPGRPCVCGADKGGRRLMCLACWKAAPAELKQRLTNNAAGSCLRREAARDLLRWNRGRFKGAKPCGPVVAVGGLDRSRSNGRSRTARSASGATSAKQLRLGLPRSDFDFSAGKQTSKGKGREWLS